MKKKHSNIILSIIILLVGAISFTAVANPYNTNKVKDKIENAASNSQEEDSNSENQEFHELLSAKIFTNVASYQLDGSFVKYFIQRSSLFIPKRENPVTSELVLEQLPFEEIVFHHYIAPNAP